MRQPIITSGMHKLSGVSHIKVEDEHWGNREDGILLTIDGENYIAVTDPDDGYRSYGAFYRDDKNIQKVTFPEQDVIVDYHQVRTVNEDGYDVDYDELVIYNTDGQSILRIGTDHSDCYYPCAIFRYNPENLPINKELLRKGHEEKVGEYITGLINRSGDTLDDTMNMLDKENVPTWMTLLDAYYAVHEVLQFKTKSILN